MSARVAFRLWRGKAFYRASQWLRSLRKPKPRPNPYEEDADGYRPAWARAGYSKADFMRCKERWNKETA